MRIIPSIEVESTGYRGISGICNIKQESVSLNWRYQLEDIKKYDYDNIDKNNDGDVNDDKDVDDKYDNMMFMMIMTMTTMIIIMMTTILLIMIMMIMK